MAFAANSPVTVPDGTKPISQVSIGDTVTVFTPNGTQPKQITFSSGTGPGERHANMVYIEYSEGHGSLIVTPDQPVMMADHKLKRATNLTPGDKLMGGDGQATMAMRVSMGMYSGGLQSVMTNGAREGSDGHFIIVSGVVCGDFHVEIHFDSIER
jgi:hypothetical protein